MTKDFEKIRQPIPVWNCSFHTELFPLQKGLLTRLHVILKAVWKSWRHSNGASNDRFRSALRSQNKDLSLARLFCSFPFFPLLSCSGSYSIWDCVPSLYFEVSELPGRIWVEQCIT
ncbi:hypothetical protein TNCT_559371 [Trichonephila clavata]|uniref:Uncharacterized protein n=1 Tax=Trichonephila clavata TaxID=2740835 RepID=A0A8X6H585_TRICU|nr:hypothetical protein TNCT_559371 [Trichonephila clavata]